MYLRVKNDGLDPVLNGFDDADKRRIRLIVRWFDAHATTEELVALSTKNEGEGVPEDEEISPASPLSAGAKKTIALSLQRAVHLRLKDMYTAQLGASNVPGKIRTLTKFPISRIGDSLKTLKKKEIGVDLSKASCAKFRARAEAGEVVEDAGMKRKANPGGKSKKKGKK